MRKLQLALKEEYFDAIKAGTKTEEYRLDTPYWRQRLLEGGLYEYQRQFLGLILTRGYPKRGDPERTLELPWRGFTRKTITHPHFGAEPVAVFAIDVRHGATSMTKPVTQADAFKAGFELATTVDWPNGWEEAYSKWSGAQPQDQWTPADLEAGKTYARQGDGWATYLGVDCYMGDLTYKFEAHGQATRERYQYVKEVRLNEFLAPKKAPADRKPAPIDTAQPGEQILAYEPMYGWLIVSKQMDGSFLQKSTGNFWAEVPASVRFTHWLPYPGFLDTPAPSSHLRGLDQATIEACARLIKENIIMDTSAGKVLAPRQDGNRDGLHYATAILALATTEGSTE